jgi:2'-5' RNA ligase
MLSGAGIPGARWVPSENYHVTLRFIGETPRYLAEEIDLALAALKVRGFSLSLVGVGTFAKGGRRNSLWVGWNATRNSTACRARSRRRCSAAALEPERRRFQPHLTLARLDNAPEARLASFVQAHNLFRADPVAVEHFTLFSYCWARTRRFTRPRWNTRWPSITSPALRWLNVASVSLLAGSGFLIAMVLRPVPSGDRAGNGRQKGAIQAGVKVARHPGRRFCSGKDTKLALCALPNGAGQVVAATIDSTFPPGALDEPSMRSENRKLFGILSLDMVGYSRLIGLDDVGTVARLHTLRRDLISQQIDLHRGRLVQVAGDSFLVIFDSITEAVRCAMALQRQIPSHERAQPADRRIRFRIGIEIGDLISDGADLHGEGVNIAARLQTACPPGGICVSDAVHEIVKSRVDVKFRSIGALNLKNIAEPVEVIRRSAGSRRTDRVERRFGASKFSTFHVGTGASVSKTSRRSATLGCTTIRAVRRRHVAMARRRRHRGRYCLSTCRAARTERDLAWVNIGFRVPVPDLRYIGRRLGARYVVRGAFRHAGSRFRLMTELSDVETGAVLWARTTELKNILTFENQDRVVGQIVNTLAPRVQEIELRRIRGKRPESLSVYEKLLLARNICCCCGATDLRKRSACSTR